MQQNYQTRSQMPISVNTARNTPLISKGFTPMMSHAASPRVPARTQNLSPINWSQGDIWNMESYNQAIALDTNHLTNFHFANVVVHQVTVKEMEYTALIKYPDLQPLWKIGFGNEVGRLFQSIHGIQGTNTCLFIELKNIPKDRQITYEKIVCDYKPHKKEK
jgi:hypothetical protein